MKAGTLKQKQAMPGNVYHEKKKFMSEGEGAHAGSLNPLKRDTEEERDEAEEKEAQRLLQLGHTQEVTGMYIEMGNTTMATSSLDGLLIFWDFGSHSIIKKIAHECPLTMMLGFQDGGKQVPDYSRELMSSCELGACMYPQSNSTSAL
jgi:hypothetical protein